MKRLLISILVFSILPLAKSSAADYELAQLRLKKLAGQVIYGRSKQGACHAQVVLDPVNGALVTLSAARSPLERNNENTLTVLISGPMNIAINERAQIGLGSHEAEIDFIYSRDGNILYSAIGARYGDSGLERGSFRIECNFNR